MAHISQELGIASFDAFEQSWPEWATCRARVEATLAEDLGGPLERARWILAMREQTQKSQRKHALAVKARAAKQMREQLGDDDQLALKMATGTEAAAFMLCDEDNKPMPDQHFSVSIRRRLRHTNPGCRLGNCLHKGARGAVCNRQLTRDGGHHAAICRLAGGPIKRHNGIRDTLKAWMAKYNISALTEQVVAHWSSQEDGDAILDLVFTHPELGEIYIDVSVCDAAFPGAPRDNWWALERRERAKHGCYPGPGLYPFVLDTRGRWGREADALIRLILRAIPEEQRIPALLDCRLMVARSMQMAVAGQILTAAVPPGSLRATAPRRAWRRG